MKTSLQLYTVRKYTKKELYKTLEKIRRIGYENIEAARINFNNSTADILNLASKDLGITTYSSQITYKQLKKEFSNMVYWLNAINCKIAVVSVLPSKLISKGENELKVFCNELNLLGEKYFENGITLAFHHHNFEFLRFGGKRGMDILISELDPKLVKFVLDTYWAQKGGVVPSELIKQLDGRICGIHLRDYEVIRKGYFVYASDCPVGSGMLDIKNIVEKSSKSGAEYIAIEQKSKHPFKDIQKSWNYLNTVKY